MDFSASPFVIDLAAGVSDFDLGVKVGIISMGIQNGRFGLTAGATYTPPSQKIVQGSSQKMKGTLTARGTRSYASYLECLL